MSPDLQRRLAVLVAAAVPLIELFWGPESPPRSDSLRFTPSRAIVLWGVGVGLAVAGLNIALFAVLAWRGLLEGFSLEYVPPNGWDSRTARMPEA